MKSKPWGEITNASSRNYSENQLPAQRFAGATPARPTLPASTVWIGRPGKVGRAPTEAVPCRELRCGPVRGSGAGSLEDPGTTDNPWSRRKLRGFLPAAREF